jgi:hypothetical protein
LEGYFNGDNIIINNNYDNIGNYIVIEKREVRIICGIQPHQNRFAILTQKSGLLFLGGINDRVLL